MLKLLSLFIIFPVIAGFIEASHFDEQQFQELNERVSLHIESKKASSKSDGCRSEEEGHCHHGHGHTAIISLSENEESSSDEETFHSYPEYRPPHISAYLSRLNRPPIA